MSDSASPLQQLAALYGVQVAYHDASGREQQTPPEAVVRVLQVLGAPLKNVPGASDALRQRLQSNWRRGLEPVSVAWQGDPAAVLMRSPASLSAGVLPCFLRLEGGQQLDVSRKLEELPVVESVTVEGVPYIARRLPLPA